MGEEGSAVVETALVSVVLVFLLLGLVQVAVYLDVRNRVAASAADGARYAANADVGPADGAARAQRLAGADVTCTGGEEAGPAGLRLATVHCRGALPPFFAPLTGLLPLDVTAHAIEEDVW